MSTDRSQWVEDFRLQAIEHARHTKKKAGVLGSGYYAYDRAAGSSVLSRKFVANVRKALSLKLLALRRGISQRYFRDTTLG